MTGALATERGGLELRCVDVNHVYHVDGEDHVALRSIHIHVRAGETVALFGPSGSGKSTLTALLAGLRRPTSGAVWLGDVDLAASSERHLLRIRSRQVGVVVQNPSRSLLPYGSAEDNVRFAQRAVDRDRRRTLSAPLALLRQLGLHDLAGQRAARLSGGEQQRLSIAVAMSGAPQVLLADEPTSQLDAHNRDRVVELMHTISREFATTIVVVTHDPVVADATNRRITLADGRIVDDGRPQFGSGRGW